MGFVPVAPGTAGTVAAVPLVLVLGKLSGPWYVAATVALLVIGAVAATVATADTSHHDPGWIVIDEVAGLLVTMTLLPMRVDVVVVGFLLFRLFDIVKPLGIDRLERLPGGAGVMLDDFAAGVLANVVIQLGLLIDQIG